MKTQREAIIPGHPRWQEFIDQFYTLRSLGPGLEGTRAVLHEMPDISVNRSVREMQALGGDNDVEVFFNLIVLEGTSHMQMHLELEEAIPGGNFFSTPLETVRVMVREQLQGQSCARCENCN